MPHARSNIAIHSSLDAAIIENNIDKVRSLLAQSPASINFINDNSFPLLTAVHQGNQEIVTFLLEQGANINLANQNGVTPLYGAVTIGCEKIVKYLLDKGADANAADRNNCLTPLHIAVNKGHENIVRLLLDKGACVNVANKNGFTALHLAVWTGSQEIVKYLLEKGADVNAANQDGVTPLHLAASRGHQEIVTLLLEKGANVNVTNKNGFTALHLAVRTCSQEIVKYLLEKGADLTIADKDGVTPLMIGIKNRSTYPIDAINKMIEKNQFGMKHISPAEQGQIKKFDGFVAELIAKRHVKAAWNLGYALETLSLFYKTNQIDKKTFIDKVTQAIRPGVVNTLQQHRHEVGIIRGLLNCLAGLCRSLGMSLFQTDSMKNVNALLVTLNQIEKNNNHEDSNKDAGLKAVPN